MPQCPVDTIAYPAMLSPNAIAQIKAEIDGLEALRKICNDHAILRVIDEWIKQAKKKLAKGTAKSS